MSSPSVIVSQQSHQQMSASYDYSKSIPQSPAYSSIPITGSTNLARTQSVGSAAIKFGTIAPSDVQLFTGSTSGTENSDKSLVTRTTAFNVVHIGPGENEEAARSLKTVRVECAMINRHGENHKDCSTFDCTLSSSTDKINVAGIPHSNSRSGSPLLVTNGSKEPSQMFSESPGLNSLHSLGSIFDDEDESKQDLEIDYADNIDCNSVHLVPAASDLNPLQETWNANLLPNRLGKLVVEVTDRNAQPQLCSVFQPVENSLKSLHSMSTSNQENSFTACASASCSAVTELQQEIMHSDIAGTDGWTDKMLEYRPSLPVPDSAGMWKSSGNEQYPVADNSRKVFCSKSWNASGYRQTSFLSGHLSSMNEYTYSLPSRDSNEPFLEWGSTRNPTRTCSHCGTIKTPLWRSGPLGPKSLCNACGIRLKKACRRIPIGDSADNSVSLVSRFPISAAKRTSKLLKRKLEKPNPFPVDSWFARARLKAALNHTPKLHLSKKTNMFAPQFRKVEAGEASCEIAGMINKKNRFSSPPTSLWRTSSACTHESPVIHKYRTSPSDSQKLAIATAKLEVESLHTANPSSLPKSFSADEEEGAILLMALSYNLVNARHENL